MTTVLAVEARPKTLEGLSSSASNEHGARLAQVALEAYFAGRTELRKGGVTAPNLAWSETDIADLMTDLLILARHKDYDLEALLVKAEAHIRVKVVAEID